MGSPKSDHLVSIVIPLFNEERAFPELSRRLKSSLAAAGISYEVIFVNDGSTDQSAELLWRMAEDDARFKVVTLSRNFGHQAALSAGLDFAEGDAVVMMDGDLQDPPEMLPSLIEKWRRGAEIVLTVKSRRREPLLARIGFWMFYRLIRLLANVDIPVGAGIFSLMDRRVVVALKQLPERSRYLVGLRSWVGFRREIVPYERPDRPYGSSRVGIIRLLRLALDGIFSFSLVPLRFITLVGFLVSAGSFLMGARIVFLKLFTTEVVIPGWASLVVAATFFGGVQLMVLGILGEYLGRVLEEVKGRPLYIVKEIRGKFSNPPFPTGGGSGR